MNDLDRLRALANPIELPTPAVEPDPIESLAVDYRSQQIADPVGSLLSEGELLTAVLGFVRRFVVLTIAQSTAVALWILHTHAMDAADATPYINASSAEKRSGKTRLLETLAMVVARPWFTGRTSVAALVRKTAKDASTLLLDETDAAFSGDKTYSEALRGILNSGYKRGGVATLCVGQGSNQEAKDYPVFSPKALAGIGDRLPDTIKDRSIPIRLKRRISSERVSEHVEKFRPRDVRHDADRLRSQIQTWASSIRIQSLAASRPTFPNGLPDRAEEVWEPLLAIADDAGGDWPQKARSAMVELCSSEDADDDSTGVRLLADLRSIFNEAAADDPSIDRLASTEIVSRLVEREESPWSEWTKGKPITARGLASVLKQFGIKPGTQRLGAVVFKGYRVDQFTDDFARYLPQSGDLSVTAVTSLIPHGFGADFTPVTEPNCYPSKNGAKPYPVSDVTDVTDESGSMEELP